MFEKTSINIFKDKSNYNIFLWGNNYTYPASQRTLRIREFFKNKGIKISGDNSYGNSILKIFSNRFNYPISEIEIHRLPIVSIEFPSEVEKTFFYSDDFVNYLNFMRK